MGHSLDKSDHAKLKHLFSENKNARITVFYHDETSFQRYIDNITEILGESDVAVRVRFYHQENQLNGLLLPFWSFEDGRSDSSIIDSAEEKISEILTDHFINNEIPDVSGILSANTLIESVTIESVDRIELHNEQMILARGSGNIEVKLQTDSNSDLRRGDGVSSSMSFPLEFTLRLIIENATGKPEDEKYSLDDVDFRIDTSSYKEWNDGQ